MSYILIFFECYGPHRDLHVLTHSLPTRRSSDLLSPGSVDDHVAVGAGLRADACPLGAGREAAAASPSQARLADLGDRGVRADLDRSDRKSTRLNSSH